jgi:hypothetical protein
MKQQNRHGNDTNEEQDGERLDHRVDLLRTTWTSLSSKIVSTPKDIESNSHCYQLNKQLERAQSIINIYQDY